MFQHAVCICVQAPASRRRIVGAPLVAGGRASAINPADGHVIWRGNVYGWTLGTPLVTADRIYAGAAGGTPYFIRHDAGFVSLDRKTGKLLTRWPFTDSGSHQWGIAGSPARSGDRVVVATMAGSLYAFPMR